MLRMTSTQYTLFFFFWFDISIFFLKSLISSFQLDFTMRVLTPRKKYQRIKEKKQHREKKIKNKNKNKRNIFEGMRK